MNNICSILNCGKPHKAYGWCVRHYTRWRKHGDPVGGNTRYKTPEEAFDARVDKSGPNGCWIWTGSKNANGYGTLFADGKAIRTHRFAWEQANGPIPKGKGYHGVCVLHRCDIPACVNPDHLFLGTQQDNVADKVAKRRARGGNLKGESHGMAKLTEPQVIAIRADQRPQARIADGYNIAQSLVCMIKTRKIWRCVP